MICLRTNFHPTRLIFNCHFHPTKLWLQYFEFSTVIFILDDKWSMLLIFTLVFIQTNVLPFTFWIEWWHLHYEQMAVERRLVGSSCIFLISISLVTHINILQPLFGPWRMLPLSFLSTPCLKLSSSTNRSIIGGTSPEEFHHICIYQRSSKRVIEDNERKLLLAYIPH